MSQLTWLHLSDIHFHPKLAWRDGRAQDALLTYLKQCFKEEWHFQIGEVMAYSGRCAL
jgi:hypothetical protein